MTIFIFLKKRQAAVEVAAGVVVAATKKLSKNISKNITASLVATVAAFYSTSGVASDDTPDLPSDSTADSDRPLPSTWDYQGEFIYYSEADRVNVSELNILAKYAIDTDEFITLKAGLDVITGPTPTGQIVSPVPQTFTGASGPVNEVGANEVPYQTGYNEARGSGSITYGRSHEDYSYSVTGSFSRESDYTSLGFGSNLSFFFNQKNTTFELGFAANNDSVEAYFGTPIPLTDQTPFAPRIDERIAVQMEDQTKRVTDLILGFTQITDKKSFITVLFSFGRQSGYLTDPYKVVSVVANPLASNAGEPISYTAAEVVRNPAPDASGEIRGEAFIGQQKLLYERRPSSKSLSTFYIAYKRAVGRGVLDISERFYRSSWGITSNTIDFGISAYVSESVWLRPHLRYYQQSAADFYQAFITESEFNEILRGSRRDISADYRLSEFTGTTIGLELGLDESEVTIAIESYIQRIAEPNNKFGALVGQDLIPNLETITLRIGFAF